MIEPFSQLPVVTPDPSTDFLVGLQSNGAGGYNNVLNAVPTPSSGSGAIQLLSSHAAKTANPINLNTTSDQSITLTGGTVYLITDIVMINEIGSGFNTAADGEWWTGASRTGTELFNTLSGALSSLTSNNIYINVADGGIIITTSSNTHSPIYFSLGTDNGGFGHQWQCDMYVYGYILA